MVINGGGKFQQWTASGALATFAWVLVLIVYCTFRAFGIEDPIIGQAFLLLTGLWVGNLTIAQSRKVSRTDETANRAETKADELEARTTAVENREAGRSQSKGDDAEEDQS